MRLGGDNRGTLTGPVTVSGDAWFRLENQYALGGSTTNPYAATNSVISNGGRFHSGSGLAFLQTEFVINQDTRFGFNNGILGSMVVNAYANNSLATPTVVSSPTNLLTFVAGLTTLNGPTSFYSTLPDSIFLQGGLAGAGALQKWGVGNLSVGGASTYSAGIEVNQGALVSLAGSAIKPFGDSALTVNPGAMIGVSNAANVGTGGLVVKSDLTGLGVLNMQYVGALPAVTFSSAAAGYDGVVALDVVGFSTALDQSAIGGGKTFLGGGLSTQSAIYNAATLGAGAGSTYRLGGGAGTLWLNTPVLTGANAVQFGAISNVVQAQSISPTLGGGTIFLNTANDYSGGTTFNLGQNIEIGNAGALGSGTLIFNGGALNPNGNLGLARLLRPLTVTNAIRFLGDATINANGADFILSGNVALTSDAYGTGQGAARTITAASTTARAVLSGVISDSGGGTASFSHLIKAGAGVLELRGTNTYTGFTQVNAGTLVIGFDGAIPSGSHVILNGGALAVWDRNLTFT
jgi:autotransporter-associated beta strand protein